MKISAIFLAVFVGLASAADSLENDRLLAQLDLESLKQAAAQLPSLVGGGPVNQVNFCYNRQFSIMSGLGLRDFAYWPIC